MSEKWETVGNGKVNNAAKGTKKPGAKVNGKKTEQKTYTMEAGSIFSLEWDDNEAEKCRNLSIRVSDRI